MDNSNGDDNFIYKKALTKCDITFFWHLQKIYDSEIVNDLEWDQKVYIGNAFFLCGSKK